jgi:hypothetical protein
MGGQLSASQRLNGAYTLRLALNVHQDAHRTKAKYLAVEDLEANRARCETIVTRQHAPSYHANIRAWSLQDCTIQKHMSSSNMSL